MKKLDSCDRPDQTDKVRSDNKSSGEVVRDQVANLVRRAEAHIVKCGRGELVDQSETRRCGGCKRKIRRRLFVRANRDVS